MTTVTEKPVRDNIAADSFADLTCVPVVAVRWESAGCLAVTFDGVLDGATVSAVRNRMLTADQTQESARSTLAAHLADLRDEGTDPDLYVALADVLAYLLGEAL